MGKVIYRLPSKGTQYGYAEYHFDFDGDPHTLGTEYRDFVTKFIAGEAAAQKAASTPKVTAKKVEYEVPITESQLYAALDGPEDVQAAAEQMLIDGLGATVYDEPVEEEAAPWEAPPAAPSEDDWEF